MRARSAALISRIAAFRSSGVVSQCGSAGRAGGAEGRGGRHVSSFSEDSLLEEYCRRPGVFRQESLLEWLRMAPAKPSLDLLRSLTDEHVLRALMEQRRLTRAELAARTGLSKPTVVRERAPAERGRSAGGHRRADHRTRAGRLVLRASPTTSAAPWWSASPRRGSWPRLLDVHGDVIVHGDRRRRAPSTAGAGRRGADDGGRGRCRRMLATAPARGGQRRRPGGPGHRPPGPPARRAVPARRTVPGRRAGRRSSTARSWSTTTSTGRPGPNATPPTASDSTTSPTCTWARVWAAPSSTTARSAAATPASPARSPTSSRPARTGAPSPSSTCSARSTSAVRHRRRSTCPHCWRRSDATMRRHAICGQPWPGRSAASSPPWSPSPTPQSSSSAAPGAPTPVVLDAIAAEFERLPRHVPIRAARLTDAPSLAGARNHALHELQAAIATSTRSP